LDSYVGNGGTRGISFDSGSTGWGKLEQGDCCDGLHSSGPGNSKQKGGEFPSWQAFQTIEGIIAAQQALGWQVRLEHCQQQLCY
jgi:hypothetical protein